MEILMVHATLALAGKNSEARGSAIATSDTAWIKHNLEVELNFILKTLASIMGITLPETQSGIPLRLDTPCTESNRPSIDWSLLDSLESNLLEPEAEMDLGDDPALDFLLDRDVGLVTICDSSRPPVCNLAP